MRINRATAALAAYALIVFAFRFGLERSTTGQALGVHLRFAFASFALLLSPLWFFAFGAGEWLRERLRSRTGRIFVPASLGIPYLVFALHMGSFDVRRALLIFGLPVVLAAFLELTVKGDKLVWQDGVVLAVLIAVYMLHLLANAWPYMGLAVLPKLYVADLALYLYMVVRKLDGMGYSLAPKLGAIAIGLREWSFFVPFGIGIGFALHFIHFHSRMPSGTRVLASLVVTFLLIALPEEMFFRTILQNLLETRLRSWLALGVAATLFGLSHFNKGATFNWRYVLLAAMAGVFYGRAWRARRQVLASVITHTAVDVVWSLWFR